MRGAKVCPVSGCPNLRPCPKEGHERKPWTGGDPDQRAKRKQETSSQEWRRFRDQVLKLWPICYVCGLNPATEVDHIVPDFEGGTTDLGNAAGICTPCHRTKSAREGQRARQALGGHH